MRRLSLLFLSLGFLGCVDPDFNRPELLKTPRILAIQAEPPQPSFGAATTLRALVYQPKPEGDAADCASGGNPNPTYHWSWCPLPTTSANGFACPVEQTALEALWAPLALLHPELGLPPSLDLGTGETATLRNPFPAALLYLLCIGDSSLPPPLQHVWASRADGGERLKSLCDMPNYSDPDYEHPLGFPITIRLEYTPPCGSPPQDKYGEPLTAVFTVHLPTDDTLPPNQNPVVGGIFAMFGFDPDAAVPLPPPPDAGTPVEVDGGASDDGGGAALDAGEPIDAGEGIDTGPALDASEAIDSGTPISDAPALAPDILPPPPDGSVPVGNVTFPRDKRIGLWLDLPLSASEFLVRPGKLDEIKAEKDAPPQIYYFERLALLWFAEAGQFGAQHGMYSRHGGFSPAPNELALTPEDETSLETARQTQWALPLKEDYDPDYARVVVVVRDSRGGVTWAHGVAPLEKSP